MPNLCPHLLSLPPNHVFNISELFWCLKHNRNSINTPKKITILNYYEISSLYSDFYNGFINWNPNKIYLQHQIETFLARIHQVMLQSQTTRKPQRLITIQVYFLFMWLSIVSQLHILFTPGPGLKKESLFGIHPLPGRWKEGMLETYNNF